MKSQHFLALLAPILVIIFAAEFYQQNDFLQNIKHVLIVTTCLSTAAYFDYRIYRIARYGPELPMVVVILMYLKAPLLLSWSLVWIFGIHNIMDFGSHVTWLMSLIMLHPFVFSLIGGVLRGRDNKEDVMDY